MGKYFILLILFPLITYSQGGFGVDSNKTLDNGKPIRECMAAEHQ